MMGDVASARSSNQTCIEMVNEFDERVRATSHRSRPPKPDRASHTHLTNNSLDDACRIYMQLETGMPFLLHKDHINARSNQRHRGTIRGSNLCTEITLHTSAQEVAVCNLASISLTPLTRDATREECKLCRTFDQDHLTEDFSIYGYRDDCTMCSGGFNFRELYHITRLVVRNLDRTIDVMHYPLVEAERANKLHRPLGIGVQGLANVFAKLRIPWNSSKASLLNRRIFETLYRAALHESCDLARVHGMPYLTYALSPAERSGMMQHDLFTEWANKFVRRNDNEAGVDALKNVYDEKEEGAWLTAVCPEAWSWTELRNQIEEHGLRNSQRLAPMTIIENDRTIDRPQG